MGANSLKSCNFNRVLSLLIIVPTKTASLQHYSRYTLECYFQIIYENHHGGYSFMCLDQLRRNEIFSMVWSWNTWVHHVIYPLGLKIFVISTLDSFLRLLGYFWFLFFFLGRTGEGGSTSTSESTRDDAFRSLFSNRLDDFMDSTSSTGDIFPPPLASSRSGQLITHLFKLIHPCGGRHWEWHFITYKTTWAQVLLWTSLYTILSNKFVLECNF